jgi:ribosomal protein L7/L12
MGDVDMVDVILVDAGMKKTDVIMALREVTTTEAIIELIDLGMAKRFTESTPCVVVPNVPSGVADRVKESLEKAGATVELKLA